MEQFIDEYLRDIFGETLLERKANGKAGPPLWSETVPELATKTSKAVKKNVEKVGGGVQKVAKGIGRFAKAHPLAVGSMALGAGAYAAHRYLTAAARACAQYRGTTRTQCMQRYKSKSMRAEVLSLKENCIICLEDPNRELCLEIVKLRISELRQEMKKLK